MDFAFPPPPPDQTLIVLIRHGATDNNVAHPPRLQGRGSDLPLSEAGLRQAEACGKFLAGADLAAVVSSPMLRARQTAAPIARARGLEVECLDALIEVDIGRCEGRTWEEMEQLEPQGVQAFRDDPGLHPYPGGEDFAQVQARVVPAIERLARRHPGQAVVVTAHNVVNRSLLAHALELPLRYARRIPQHNGGVSLLRVTGERMQVLGINSIVHLPVWE